MKIYNVEGRVHEWVRSHSTELYDDILMGAEDAAPYEDECVIVCGIRSITGITEYILRTPEEVVQSLKKAENYYVTTEEYEKAARARDCGMIWEDKAMIYRKNTRT